MHKFTDPSQVTIGTFLGMGAPMAAETAVALVVDLAQVETHRLPPLRHAVLAGFPVDLVYGPCTPHLPAAIWLRCHHGRQE